MTKTITLADAVVGLHEIVRGWEHHKYVKPEGQSSCLYVHNSTTTDLGLEPGCIVGHFIARLGISLTDMLPVNSCVVTQDAVRTLLQKNGFEIDDAAVTYLRAAQFAQDDGAAWGKAVAAADSRLRLQSPGF